MNVRYKQIRALVQRLLNELRCPLGAVDIELLAKRYNTLVHRQDVDDDFSGYLYRDLRQGSAVIGVNAKHHPNRQRFTIAHELGHFLLHAGEEVHVDRQFVTMRRDKTSSEGANPQEIEANFFAAELLMPEHFLAEEIAQLGSPDFFNEDFVRPLAKKYRVSEQAMTIRLTTLKFL